MCRITVLHGGGGVKCFLFSKWRPEILHEVEYLVFRNYFVFFWKKKSDEIHVFQSDQFSLLMYRCLLPSLLSKWITKKNMENARYTMNDDTPI